MLIVVKGAGDIASGVAFRLFRAGMDVVMTDIQQPTAIRRTVCFSRAVQEKEAVVEDVHAVLAKDAEQAKEIIKANSSHPIKGKRKIAVIVDPDANCVKQLCPDAVVDAILAKHNINTKITDAPVVVALGPGFEAGKDCHAVVETKRGHTLGRVITKGAAIANSGVPGNIGGHTTMRILRAPDDGVFVQKLEIGAIVKAGDVAGSVNGKEMLCEIDGILRGILPNSVLVHKGMKSGDIDPRCETSHCYTISDKALSVGGGVLEAVLMLAQNGGCC